VPHICRLIVGPDARLLLPVSGLVGAGFLIVADTFARSAFGAMELPVGIVTALLGAPFFCILLVRQRRTGWT
jgi:iron complex transport system permease protein